MCDDRREEGAEDQETPESKPEPRGGRPQEPNVERAVALPPETR